jgi:hypothetical protein
MWDAICASLNGHDVNQPSPSSTSMCAATVRMQKIATIERTCDCGEALHLRAEVDGHAVASAEIAIDLIERTQSPFLKASAVAARL